MADAPMKSLSFLDVLAERAQNDGASRLVIGAGELQLVRRMRDEHTQFIRDAEKDAEEIATLQHQLADERQRAEQLERDLAEECARSSELGRESGDWKQRAEKAEQDAHENAVALSENHTHMLARIHEEQARAEKAEALNAEWQAVTEQPTPKMAKAECEGLRSIGASLAGRLERATRELHEAKQDADGWRIGYSNESLARIRAESALSEFRERAAEIRSELADLYTAIREGDQQAPVGEAREAICVDALERLDRIITKICALPLTAGDGTTEPVCPDCGNHPSDCDNCS